MRQQPAARMPLRREIDASVFSGRKTASGLLYNVSAPTVSRIVVAHRVGLA
jgi:hypothetical protein